MPQSITGLTKKADSNKITATNTDITSSDISSLISSIKDLIDDMNSASGLKSTSKEDRKALSSAVSEMSQILRDTKDLEKKRNDLIKRSVNLSKEQRERLLDSFDEDVASYYKNLSKISSVADSVSLPMVSKFGKKRAEEYNNSIESISKTLNSIDKRSERRAQKESIEEKLRSQTEQARGQVSKFGESALDTIMNPLFHTLLGPLQLFTKPLEDLFHVDLYQIPKSLMILRKRTPASRERVLADGGVFGAGMVLIYDALMKKETGSDFGIGDLSDDILSVFGASSIFSQVMDGLKKVFSGGALSNILKVLTSGAAIGVSIWGIADGVLSYFTKAYEDVNSNAKQTAIDAVDNEQSLFWTSLTSAFEDTPDILAGAFADAVQEDSFIAGVGTFISSVFKRSEERYNSWQAGLTEANLKKMSEETGIDFEELVRQYNADLLTVRASGNNPYLWSEFWDKWSKALKGVTATPQFVVTEEGSEFVNSLLTNAGEYIAQQKEDNPLFIRDENGNRIPNPDYVSPLDLALPRYDPNMYSFTHLDPLDLNDAIIYKDNSVYVPHPEDNIVLTQNDVGTGSISSDSLDQIIELLTTISQNTEAGNSPIVNIANTGNSGSMDFSALRV